MSFKARKIFHSIFNLLLLIMMLAGAVVFFKQSNLFPNREIGGTIVLLAWILVLAYKKTAICPQEIKSLPKNRLYFISAKARKGKEFIFRLHELKDEGVSDKEWTLVHNEDIQETYFRIDGDRKLIPVTN